MRTHFYFVLLFEMRCCWVLAYIRHLFSSPKITLASSFVVIFFLRSHYDYFLVTVHLWVGVIFFFLETAIFWNIVFENKRRKSAVWADRLNSDLLFLNTFSSTLSLVRKLSPGVGRKTIYLAHSAQCLLQIEISVTTLFSSVLPD